MKRLILASALCSLIPALTRAADMPASHGPSATAKASVTIDKIAVGTAIENRELTGTATSFDSATTRVYCWTHITADQAPVSIKHVWYADDKKEADVPLQIKSESGRTWSSKSVWPAKWKVDATTDAGEVLSSTEFTVTK